MIKYTQDYVGTTNSYAEIMVYNKATLERQESE